MKVNFESITSLEEIKTSVLVLYLTEEILENYLLKNGRCICGVNCNCGEVCNCEKNSIQEAVYTYSFTAKKNENVSVGYKNFFIKDKKISFPNKVILIGLGKENELNNSSLEEIGYKTIEILKKNNVTNATFIFNAKFRENSIEHSMLINGNLASLAICHLILGMELGEYSFNKYLTNKNKTKLNEITFAVYSVDEIKTKYNDFSIIKENVLFCRNLINEPANVIYPESFVQIAKELSQLKVKVDVLKEKDMEKLNMGALLSVGQGSEKDSYLLVLSYNNSEKQEDPIAFVGKGVTFDSGGLSLKPSSTMETMKCDMSGGAVVLSLIRLLAMRNAKVNVIGVIPLVENMPSGTATRVGDIVTSMSGQTIEINNTDAEGRMILADALYYVASTYKPKLLIDLATLTGAICVALGEGYAGLFTNNDELYQELNNVSKKTGELVWRMPISPIGGYYDRMIDSDVADMTNSEKSRMAGSITAAQFLQRFINNHVKWAHLDIAATAYINKERFLTKKNATGFGVRLLNELVKNYYED